MDGLLHSLCAFPVLSYGSTAPLAPLPEADLARLAAAGWDPRPFGRERLHGHDRRALEKPLKGRLHPSAFVQISILILTFILIFDFNFKIYLPGGGVAARPAAASPRTTCSRSGWRRPRCSSAARRSTPAAPPPPTGRRARSARCSRSWWAGRTPRATRRTPGWGATLRCRAAGGGSRRGRRGRRGGRWRRACGRGPGCRRRRRSARGSAGSRRRWRG